MSRVFSHIRRKLLKIDINHPINDDKALFPANYRSEFLVENVSGRMMRNTRTLLWIGVCLAGAVTSAPAQKADTKTVNLLMQIERDIGQANIRRDKKFFENIEADEFIFTDSGGGITTKAEDVASLDKTPGDLRLISYEVDEMKVSVYGATAVVTGRTTTVSKGKDREVTSRSRFTDVFVKRNGRWQLVAGHSSRIREPQK